jgi:cell division protein FtsI (penicillin-binding protein 3)
MGWRLVSVQVVSAGEYRALAERQIQREIELPASRGKLYDRAGEPFAMSLASASVYANPRAIREGGVDAAVVAADLEPVLGRAAADLEPLLRRDVAFVYLGRQLPRQVGEQVQSMRLPGIGVLSEPRRVYPAPGLASQVIGFAGTDNTGLAGLELRYDDLLAGEPGRAWLERAPGGLTINAAPREVVPAVPGTDLVLTLDRQVQWHTEEVLDRAVERFDATGAAAVVVDVRSGDVLAMAASPRFDPTDIASSDEYARRNRAVTDVFEPGSVNKVVTAAAALEEGFVTPTEVFTVPDTYQVGTQRFRDAYPHPTEQWTFADIIAKSSNIGTIMVAERLGPERLHDYLERFGYGRRTSVDFPGESGGVLPPTERWWDSSLPTIAIGQGVSATLLQVAGVFGVVASGGTLLEPRLVRGTVDADGRLRQAVPEPAKRVISEETAAALSRMLVGVVEEGTGGRAAVPGYAVAGKTGTAQKPSPTSRGYLEGAYVATFAGMAPASSPALVAAVMIDEPTPIWGSETAAPVFSEIMEFALSQRRVPPSDPELRATATPARAPAGE